MKTNYLLILLLAVLLGCKQKNTITYDIVVYGSTSSGIIAAYTAKMKGMNVLLISPDGHLGGLTTGGLGYTDIGNKYAINGLAKDFYRKVGEKYGAFEQWIFEPHVASEVYGDYIKKAGLEILYDYRVTDVTKKEGVIASVVLENSNSSDEIKELAAKVFIDASYEGDLMASAGVTYTVGREANLQYNETFNGVQVRKNHQFPDGIDPYKVKGDSTSGLLWGISENALDPPGTGDEKVQAYNFRLCLSKDPENAVPITKPDHYDPAKYELLLRLFEAFPERRTLNDYFILSNMPNKKTDINNRGAFSTDMIGMNHHYPEASYEERDEITKSHVEYTKGLLYFYKTDPRVPEALRIEMQQWGYPKDEYTDNGHWSPQMYVREVRRMVGEYVMTQHNCQAREVVEDGIAMAAYTMDSHNCQRLVVVKDGVSMVKNEGNVEIGGFGPYPIAYRSIVPKAVECKNLIVPVCLSASHIAYGSIRMEPVFMALGQAAGLAAEQAVTSGVEVQSVDVTSLKEELRKNPLSDSSTPEILIDNMDYGVTKIGDWQSVQHAPYGPDVLEYKGEGSSEIYVRFNARIKETGRYQLFYYFANVEGLSTITTLKVLNGKEQLTFNINKEKETITGQTSGKWVFVDNLEGITGEEIRIDVSTEGADGVVRADAVLLVPGK